MLLVGATYMAFSPSDMEFHMYGQHPHLKQGIQPAARRCFRTQPQGQQVRNPLANGCYYSENGSGD